MLNRAIRFVAAAALAALWLGCSGAVESSGSAAGERFPGAGQRSSPREGMGATAMSLPAAVPPACVGSAPVSRAPLRRLTRFEYDNSVRDLLGDTTHPAAAFPSEEIGNGFGNDADAQSVSSLLAEQYSAAAETIAQRATSSPELLAKLHPCAPSMTATTDATAEATCARSLIEGFVRRAYRRPVLPDEVDELLTLHDAIRASSSFAVAIGAVIEAVLQAPDFLYRLEWGSASASPSDVLRPSGHEMATRLSYLFWGTMPDDSLHAAADAGELTTRESVLAHATRMLNDPRARPVIRFFFDNLLPIATLSGLERDRDVFPSFSSAIGSLMREETLTFLEYEIFEGSGSWRSALTAPYTFMNGPLAEFYKVAGVSGDQFVKVPLDTRQRLGLMTQAGMLAGTTHANTTSPVVRGSYVVRRLLCTDVPLPSAELLGEALFAQIKAPDPAAAPTARDRYSAHSSNPACAGCHQQMDPVGFALENYDAVGLWRDQENGVQIDATGALPGQSTPLAGPIELVRAIAESERAETCFASHWLDFAHARALGPDEQCSRSSVEAAFAQSGYDIRQLLLAITQTDAFLTLPRGMP
jgi:hypothetical protein